MKKAFFGFTLLFILAFNLHLINRVEAETSSTEIQLFSQYLVDDFSQVSSGFEFTSVITNTGKVFIWGDNKYGQLGDGTFVSKHSPTDITDKFNLYFGEVITNSSLGGRHALALSSTGRIFAWGQNFYGELGDGTRIDSNLPVDITGMFNLVDGEHIVEISTGFFHSAALTSSGRLFTWGENYDGQLGDKTNLNKSIPVDITPNFYLSNGEKIIKLSLGYGFSAAITSFGRVFTWGRNYDGQLGNGTTTQINYPSEIGSYFALETDEEIVDIIAGAKHSAAITSLGRLFMWGYNYYGQIGDGSTVNRNLPVDVTSGFSLGVGEVIAKVSLGEFHSSAITSLGKIYSWGNNAKSQIGIGSWRVGEYFTTPVDINSRFVFFEDEHPVNLSIGGSHSAIITSRGRVFTWGNNSYGQLGYIAIGSFEYPTPIEIKGEYETLPGELITKIELGGYFSGALTSLNRVLMWGDNTIGQLGIGTTNYTNEPKLTPIDITNRFNLNTGEKVIDIVLGTNHSIVLTSEGRIFTWGSNFYGQLGDGTFIDKITPQEITDKFPLNGGEVITVIDATDDFSLVITSDGRIFTWGKNISGLIGDGTTVEKNLPVDITDNFNFAINEEILSVSLGGYHALLMTSDLRIFAWGDNGWGQLGTGDEVSRYLPIEITNNFQLLNDEFIVKLATGGGYSQVLTSMGRVFSWGDNFQGQLGVGYTAGVNSPSPVNITSQFDLDIDETIVDITLGVSHSGALTSKNRLFTYGFNYFGSVGIGFTEEHVFNPVDITSNFTFLDAEYITDLYFSGDSSALITSRGRIYVWGNNESGMLGDGTTTDHFTPIEINLLTETTNSVNIVFDYEYDIFAEYGVGDNSLIQAKALDQEGNEYDIEIIGEVHWYWIGQFLITYRAFDSSGTLALRSRIVYTFNQVKIDDNTRYEMNLDFFQDEIYTENLNLNQPSISFLGNIYTSFNDISSQDLSLGTNKVKYNFIVEDRLVIADKVITVVDTTAPVFDDIENQTIELGEFEDIDWTTLIQNVNDDYSTTFVYEEVKDSVQYYTLGTYEVTVKVIDEFNNYLEKSFFVTVEDTTAPSASLRPSLDSIEQGSTYIEYGINASDLTIIDITIYGEINVSVPGTYKLTYEVTDTSGNKTVLYRYVTVYEKQDPIQFTLGTANTTIKVGDDYIDGTCKVTIYNKEYECVVKENNVNTDVEGIYSIIYSYDYEGVEYNYKRYVFVTGENQNLQIYYLPIKKEEGEI